MWKLNNGICVMLLTLIGFAGSVAAADFCAKPEQVRQIRAFYAEKPGTMPVIAAQRLEMADAVVTSGLPEGFAVSAPAVAFAEVWAGMAGWQQVSFLIMKGRNVFEIMSGVAPGKPSTRSEYFNIAYEQPLRGHLRPDLYSSIYAVDMPTGETDKRVRGVLFFDADGSLVFGVFVSGESLDPSPAEIESFGRLWKLIASQPPVCAPAPG